MKRIFLLCMIAGGVAVSNIYCKKDDTGTRVNEQVINASVPINTQYQRDLGTFGGEEGATITQQPVNFQVSELSRTNEGHIIYRYTPTPGFTGTDEVLIQVSRNSDGTEPQDISFLLIKFSIQLQTE